jgi:hypothetical protein
MLLTEHRVLALERLQPLDLTGLPPFHHAPPRSALEDPVPRLFPPAGEHEGWMSNASATVCTYTPGIPLSFTAVSLNSTL